MIVLFIFVNLSVIIMRETLAGDLAMHCLQRGGWFGVRDGGGAALGQPELGKGLFAETELFGCGYRVIIDNIQYGKHRLTIALDADLHFRQGLETLGAVDMTIAVQVGNVFLVGVDCDTSELQCMSGR